VPPTLHVNKESQPYTFSNPFNHAQLGHSSLRLYWSLWLAMIIVATLLEKSVKMRLTLSKWGFGSPPGLSKVQSSIARVKTPRIRAFFIIGKLSKCRCQKWARLSHLDICITSYGQKKGRESNWQFDSWPLKVDNRPDPDALRWSGTHCWKALDESYNFASDLVPIRGMSKELWSCKVAGVQTLAVSGLPFGSPRTKNHSDVGAMRRHKEYYMGEGGGLSKVARGLF
jgi:hypothetical protein